MPVEVILPKVDMDMSHGTLTTWHVAEGDLVPQGAPLFDIETDKATMAVEAPATGYLPGVTAMPGDKVAVGTTIGWRYAEGDAVAAAPSAPVATGPVPMYGPKPVEVILPKVDIDMSHGTLAVWHVAEGETVKQGAPLFDIETDKAAMEVEAPATDRLHHIRATPGDKVPVGAVVAWICPEGMAVGPSPQPVEAAPKPSTSAEAAIPVKAATLADTSATMATRATPAARKAARDADLTLSDVTGTGPLGRVQRDDVTGLISVRSSPAAVEPTLSTGWIPETGPLNISRRKGEGMPIVLLHGFTADSQSWAPFEKSLGPVRPPIRIDLPGHGKSPKRQVRSFQDLSRMVVEAFDDATKDLQDVHLVGHSLGAALALAQADIRGRRIASLTLIAPAGLGPEIDAAALDGIVRASRTESLAPWLRRLTATAEGISDDYARAAMRTRDDAALRACQADMSLALFPEGLQSFDMRAALQRIDLPTQILWGRRDHILPFAQGVAVIGEFGLHLMSGVGHIPQIECPDRAARIVQRMIRADHDPG